MKLLLDTHTFIWWDSESNKLSPNALTLCKNRENKLLLSVASVWEMQIKSHLGKLKLSLPLSQIIESQQKINNIEMLPIMIRHVLTLETLPSHHKDPFDRLLIVQANIEGAVLISCDSIFKHYPVSVVW